MSATLALPDRGARDRAIVTRAQTQPSEAARRDAVERFMPLARSLARRYGRGADLEDLEQVASIGLLKAIDGFDPSHGSSFSSYAVPTITGELRRHFRDKGWTVRVPRQLQELMLELPGVQDELTYELGRAPSAAELADRLGVPVERVLEAREAPSAMRPTSLDRPAGPDDEDGSALLDRFGAEDPSFAHAEDAAAVRQLLRHLPERDRLVVELRFREELTQSEIAERVGMSQMWVSIALRRSLERLRVLAEPWAVA